MRRASNTLGVRDPCALWRYADQRGGPFCRECAPAGPNHAKHFQNLTKTSSKGPKSSQLPPQTSRKPSQNPVKSLPNRAKIVPEGVLEPTLGQCLKKFRFWTAKKRPNDGKKRPEEAQDRPKPRPNSAQDRPKSIFKAILKPFFFPFQICIHFWSICCWFFDSFQELNI